MSVHFSNLYGIFKNSSYHVSKEKTSAQRQKRKNRCWADPFSRLIYILPHFKSVLAAWQSGSMQSDPIGSFCQQAFQSANLALWNRRLGTLGFRQSINLILWKPKTDTLGFTNLPPGKPKGSRNSSFGRCRSYIPHGCLPCRTAPPSAAP